MIDSVYKKNEYYCPKVFLEKYNLNNDIETYSNNSYYVDSDEEDYDEKCIDLFLKKNIVFFRKIRKNKRNFFKAWYFQVPS